jgi:ribonucleotide reductase alpha subunit
MNESIEKFLRKVERNELHELIWNDSVHSKISAKEVWNKILNNSINCGEPGILNGHFANEMNNIWYHKPLTSTNPCQPAWATILTEDGIKTFGDIKVGDRIWSGKQWTTIVHKTSNGIKNVYAYRTLIGTFYGTKNHKIVSDNRKIEVCKAKTIPTLFHRRMTTMRKQVVGAFWNTVIVIRSGKK